MIEVFTWDVVGRVSKSPDKTIKYRKPYVELVDAFVFLNRIEKKNPHMFYYITATIRHDYLLFEDL